MSDDEPFPLYHWSPTSRRKQISRRGFVPGSWSTDRLWRPPLLCFAANPELAWALSGGTARGDAIDSWDLWVTWSDVPCGMEEIFDTNPTTGRSYVKEYRVYERVYKRDLWFAGTPHPGRRAVTRDPYDVVTTEQAAQLLGVPAARISQWAHRGRVQPIGLLPGRGHGSPLYDLAELRPLAKAWHARRGRATPRRPPPG